MYLFWLYSLKYTFLTWNAHWTENPIFIVIFIFLLAHLGPWLVSWLCVDHAGSPASVLQTAGGCPLQTVAGGPPSWPGSGLNVPLIFWNTEQSLSLRVEKDHLEFFFSCARVRHSMWALNTSLMSMRPAMESLVRGEKWGVIIIRRPASENDSLWGLRMRSSSTMTTGEASWPWAWPVYEMLPMKSTTYKTTSFTLDKSFKKTKQKQTFVEKHHRCVTRRGVFSQLVVSPFFWSEAARPDAPQPTCHKHKNLGVEPVTEQTTILHHPSILTTHTYGALLTDEEVLSSGNLLHDDNVDSIHRH